MKFKFYTVIKGKEEYIHITAKTKAEAINIMKMKYSENKIRQIIIEDGDKKPSLFSNLNSAQIKKMTLIPLGIAVIGFAIFFYPKIDVLLNTEDIHANKRDPSAVEELTAEQNRLDRLSEYMEEKGLSLSYRDVQFDMSNNLDSNFAIIGEAELDDYYNYGFKDENLYFSVRIIPVDASYGDEWNIYFTREDFPELFNDLKQGNKTLNITAFIPTEIYKDNQKNLALAQEVTFNREDSLMNEQLDKSKHVYGFASESAEVSLLEVYLEHDELLNGLTNGQIPMVVKVKVTNTGQDKWYINPIQFTVSTPDGAVFDYEGVVKLNSYGEPEEQLPMIELQPGQSGEGWVGFEPTWSDSYILNYEENGSTIQLSFTIPQELMDQRKITLTPDSPITELISGN